MALVHLPNRRLRLAFCGTPEIARTVLDGILRAGEDDVVLAVCQPDRPRGRGQHIEPTPTKSLAEARGIPVVQPLKMKDGALAARLVEDRVDLAIVAAFGRILPPDVLDAVPHGFWNVHASLLPRHRGASPIQYAILEGDAETGVTLMQITPGLDEGPMMLVKSTPIGKGETQGELMARLAILGAELAVEGIRTAKLDGLNAIEQDAKAATFAPLIEKDAGKLDLADSAVRLVRRIHAFDPWPGTFVMLDGQPLRILSAEAVSGSGPPGQIMSVKDALETGTGSGRLRITRVQPAGKKPMSAAEFLRGAGRRLGVGAHLG
ncbi:MAG: methionyl-tRNA formyltransferase [Deltaproteobacteria bacterium]|nr:methionyl-tRNA formyltransferase [Deltaproteobacteria bacterium]